MDRRKLLWLGSLALGSLIGCTRREVISTDPYNPVPAAESSAGKSRTKRGARVVRRSEPDTLVTQADGKPETLVKIADVQSQLATDQQRSADQRQKALSLARHNYQRAIQIDNRHIPAYLGLGRLCSLVGDHATALSTLDQGLTHAPNDASLWFERGMVLGRQQRFDEAIQNLSRAAQLEPGNVHYTKSVGLMLARAGRPDEGVSWLGRVMPEAEARYNVGRMMQHIGRPEDARLQFESALRANPNHDGAIAALEMMTGAGRTFTETMAGPRPHAATNATALPTSSTVVKPAANFSPPWEDTTPAMVSRMTISIDPASPSPARPEPRPAAPEAKRQTVRIAFEPGD